MKRSELPTGWTLERLSEIAEVKLGRQRSPKNHSGPFMRHYLRAANITWEGISLYDVKEMNFGAEEFETFRLRPGDVLVAEASGSRSEVGKTALWQGEIEDCCYQNTLIRVRSRGPLPEFLHLVLWHAAASGQFGDSARGVGIHHLGAKALADWPVVLPPEGDQRTIVDEIDKQFTRVEAATERLKLVLRQLRAYRRTVINTGLMALQSPMVPLAEVAHLVTKGTTPTSVGFSYTDAEVRFVKVESLANGRVNHERCAWISVEADSALRRSQLRSSDVLFSIAGTLGRVAVVSEVDLPANTNQAVAIIRPTNDLQPQFLAIALSSAAVTRRIAELRRGVGLSNLNLAHIRDLNVPVPSIEVQEQFARDMEGKLSIIDNLEKEVASALRRGQRLRHLILARGLSGGFDRDGAEV